MPQPSTLTPHTSSPLAERMRPQHLSDFVGQEELVGDKKLLSSLIRNGKIPSLLLWGPPGSGKTSLARIIANSVDAHFVFFSAVLFGVKEVRKIVEEAAELQKRSNTQTILFVDEIHRFNKAQQDGFLPHVESGLLTLIGATTENPSFQVIAPLLSRCRVLVLKSLSRDHLQEILKNALKDTNNGLGKLNLTCEDQALKHMAQMADGDARIALNSLELAASLALSSHSADTKNQTITLQITEEACQQRSLRYDKSGEEHYNLISALHKSLRDSDPDGALYWLGRMLTAGEEPLYIARRLIRFASEDIGNADPQALEVALNGHKAYQILGSPEGELSLVQVAVYLATAPKSNTLYTAYTRVQKEIRQTGSLPVPLHIRNAPTRLMKELDYGKNYKYAHDHRYGLVDQEHLPDELQGRQFYFPTNRGYEATINNRLTKWRRILKDMKTPRRGEDEP